MEDDFKPAIQHQRRVNLKIHEVIKKEVIKLLDAGLIYPISDSPWVSPYHCVPKKGGMTVVENEDNEMIPTRPREDYLHLPLWDVCLPRNNGSIHGNDFLSLRGSPSRQCLSINTKCTKQLNKYVQEKQEEKNIAEEQAAKVSSQYWKPPIFYDDDDDDDKESSILLRDFIFELPLVKDLNLTLSESEDLSDNESECDVPVCDDFSPNFTTFSNPLFDSNDDFTSSDDESFSEEDHPKENFKIYSNPLFDFDEEIISSKIDPLYNEIDSIPQGNDNDHFNAESDLIESLLNPDTLRVFSPKIDSLLEEFSGELAHIDLIPPGNDEADFDPEEDIRLVEKLLYDNSSPRPPEELNSKISDAIIESFSPSPIPVEDSDSLMEEINIFLAPDDSIPPRIENYDYDSEGDVLFLEELLNNDSIPEYESFHVDFYNVPSSPRPPEKPPDDDVYFDIEPDTGVLTTKVVDDIFDNSTRELYVHVPNVLPTPPTLYPVFDTLLPFSSENEDKVFNPGILISKEEKSPHLLSHRGFKDCPDFEDSRARGFVHRSLDLQSLACLYMGIRYPRSY
ncbi:hypothetical protein Tco_1499105 [Tanacetum coccineum]